MVEYVLRGHIIMKEFLNKHIRNTSKWTDISVIAMIITFILLLVGQVLGLAIVRLLHLNHATDPAIEIAMQYFAFIGIWIIFVPLLFLKSNKPMLKLLLPNKEGNNWKGILIGSALGFGLNAVCVVLSILKKDIGLSFDIFEILPLLFIFLCVMVQSGAEELVCRLYLMNKHTRRYINPWVAVIMNSLFFAALHVFNPGVGFWPIVQIVIIGIVLSVETMYFNSFYGAVMIHTLWNYTQNIIFGLPNSGIVSPYSIFHLDAAASGFFFDPAFGVEGSPGACLIQLITLIIMIYIIRKKNLKPWNVWEEKEENKVED